MLRKVLIGFAALIVVLLAVIATRSPTFRVERSTRIAAPPDVVFALVNDFHAWDRWSPWAKLDPGMKLEIGGNSTGAGPGATYHWKGNDKVGEGDMRITDARPPQKIGIRLEFLKPMASVNQTEFTFGADGSGTRVDWSLSGPLDFMGKAMDLFVGMDRMVGADFEKGLAALRREAEAEAKKRADVATASTTSLPGSPASSTGTAAPPPPAR